MQSEVMIEVTLTEEERRRFKAATADEGTSMRAVARKLITDYCDERDAAKAGDGHASR